MIPILRVLVLFVFLLFAIGLAHSEREHRATYRLILAFVAFGATTFLPEEAILLQVFSEKICRLFANSVLEKHLPVCYNEDTNPVWLWSWLLIIQDNTIHLLINFLTLKYIG